MSEGRRGTTGHQCAKSVGVADAEERSAKGCALSERLQSIQLLRGVAVVPVVFFHFGGFDHGRAGVDLFFVISGFVMAGLVYGSPAKFALNRFTRIYPPFLAALALTLILVPQPFELVRLVKSLILWPVYKDIYLFPAWSLSYEAMFYAACAASMVVSRRYVLLAYGAAFLLGIPFIGSAFVLEFLAGFAIARRQWWAIPILLAAATTDTRILQYGAPAATLLWLGVRYESWFKHRLWQPAAMIGDASYSIYLTHVPVGTYLTVNGWNWVAIIYACILFGIAFHFAIERPLLKTSRRLVDSLAAARANKVRLHNLGAEVTETQ